VYGCRRWVTSSWVVRFAPSAILHCRIGNMELCLHCRSLKDATRHLGRLEAAKSGHTGRYTSSILALSRPRNNREGTSYDTSVNVYCTAGLRFCLRSLHLAVFRSPIIMQAHPTVRERKPFCHEGIVKDLPSSIFAPGTFQTPDRHEGATCII